MSVFVALCYWQLCVMPRATVAKLSHGSSYRLVDGFVPYYPVDLILTSASSQIKRKKMDLIFMSVFVALCYWQLCATSRATVAKLSHGSSYLLVDDFVPYYPVDLILNISILPNSYPTKPSYPQCPNRKLSTAFREPTSRVNARADFRHVTKAAPTNNPF